MTQVIVRGSNLHLGLLHNVEQLKLALSNLDDLLDKASANLLLQLVDPETWLAFGSSRKDAMATQAGDSHLERHNILVSGQLRLILPLDLFVILQRLALSPDNLVLALSFGTETLELAALVSLTIPLLNTDITLVVSGSNDEDSVAQLDGAGSAAVDSAAGNAELLGALGDELLGSRRPLLVAGRHLLLNQAKALLGHSLDRLAVQRGFRQRLKLVERRSVQVQQCRSRRAVCPKSCQAGRSAWLQIACEHTQCRTHPYGSNWLGVVVRFFVDEERVDSNVCLPFDDPGISNALIGPMENWSHVVRSRYLHLAIGAYLETSSLKST